MGVFACRAAAGFIVVVISPAKLVAAREREEKLGLQGGDTTRFPSSAGKTFLPSI
jgi:hypothetical protein